MKKAIVISIIIFIFIALFFLNRRREIRLILWSKQSNGNLNSLSSFPGAEGFGAYTQGGRGGDVYVVTNHNDEGPGSLKEAIEASGPRIVVFRVSGTIYMTGSYRIKNPYITIAGQTAPGDGICLAGSQLVIETHDVIVRYLRVRPGDINQKSEWDGISIRDRNVIVDHCSVSWSIDENISTSINADMVTVQNCIISEPLHHPKGPYSDHIGYGSLISSGISNCRISFHHNIYAHCYMRSPRPQALKGVNLILDFRNNVIYNWGHKAGYNWRDRGHIKMNYVCNFLESGLDTENYIRDKAFDIGPGDIKIYQEGNIINGMNSDWNMFRNLKDSNKKTEPVTIEDIFKVETSTAKEAYDEVLAEAGAIFPERDKVDSRIIESIRYKTGQIISSQDEVGGYPVLKSEIPPIDTDMDGMPDDWEIAHDLDPEDSSDASGTDLSEVGYTNIEVYINSLVSLK